MSKTLQNILKVNEKVNKTLKQYSKPKIYCGGGDIKDWNLKSEREKADALKKDWFVYYSYRNPDTGKLEPQKRVKIGNGYKTKTERYKILREIINQMEIALLEGYNPYSELKKSKDYTIKEALHHCILLKKESMSVRYLEDITRTANKLIKYLEKSGKSNAKAVSIDREIINNFLNHIFKNNGSKTRNDIRTQISIIFNEIEAQGIIKQNFIKSIPRIKRDKKRSKTYSSQQINSIEEYLKEKDPQLLLFVKMVSFLFLRPIELVRLRVCDINFTDLLIEDKTKTKNLKTKIIPLILLEDLKGYMNQFPEKKPDDYIFTNKGIGHWERKEYGRRDYFTKKYLKIKKEMGISNDYNIYSFRHYHIDKYYVFLRREKKMTKTQAIDHLSLITGHTGNGIYSYIHSLDSERPEDYSEGLKWKPKPFK